jgi:hypothetical protein
MDVFGAVFRAPLPRYDRQQLTRHR